MTKFPVVGYKRSVIPLILANLIPLFGVLFLGWNIGQIILLYWLESGIVGFYNILKMLLAPYRQYIQPKFILIPFFIVHYGGFMAGHLLFILFFLQDPNVSGNLLSLTTPLNYLANLKLAFISFFISHGISFVTNYLYGEERKNAGVDQLMAQPYRRIVIMHITIILGFMLTARLGHPIGLIIVWIILKIIADLLSHLRERKRFSTPKPEQPTVTSFVTPSVYQVPRIINIVDASLTIIGLIAIIGVILRFAPSIIENTPLFGQPGTAQWQYYENNLGQYSYRYPSYLSNTELNPTDSSGQPFALSQLVFPNSRSSITFAEVDPLYCNLDIYRNSQFPEPTPSTVGKYKTTFFQYRNQQDYIRLHIINIKPNGCFHISIVDEAEYSNQVVIESILQTFQFSD